MHCSGPGRHEDNLKAFDFPDIHILCAAARNKMTDSFRRRTYCLNFWRRLWSGVPNTSWILATWSNSFDPGKRGFKLKHTGTYYNELHAT